MKRIVLLRHGESTWNKENRFTGWTDVDLSEKGIEEALKAGEALKKEKISLSAIYRNLAEIEKNGHLKRFAEKNQSILTMDSMQSKTSNDVKNGTTYISIMENNLDVLTMPEEYVGKTVIIKGQFTSYEDPDTKIRYFGCIIADAVMEN